MPFKPRRYRKRMQRKPRRNMKRRKPNYNRQKVHRFTRVFNQDTAIIIAGGAAATGYGYSFALNNLPNHDDFTRLYDQYRIKAIKWQLIPKQGIATVYTPAVVPGQVAIMPKIYSVVDYDNATAPGSLGEVLQYENVKFTRANQTHTRYFKPAVADEVFASGITTGYGMNQNKWMDCNSDQVEHYGLRVWVEGSTASTPRWDFDVLCKFYMEFKNVR